VITRHLPRDARLLQIGVGTSGLQNDMVLSDGYSAIHSVDYSPIAIGRLQDAARTTTAPALQDALSFAVADMRRMPQLEDCSFGGVIDKGALDALMCGDNADRDAAKALNEAWRVLQPGAPYLMITSGGVGGGRGVLLGGVWVERSALALTPCKAACG